jgi:hypothetical protein
MASLFYTMDKDEHSGPVLLQIALTKIYATHEKAWGWAETRRATLCPREPEQAYSKKNRDWDNTRHPPSGVCYS